MATLVSAEWFVASKTVGVAAVEMAERGEAVLAIYKPIDGWTRVDPAEARRKIAWAEGMVAKKASDPATTFNAAWLDGYVSAYVAGQAR